MDTFFTRRTGALLLILTGASVGCHGTAAPKYLTNTVDVGTLRDTVTATGEVSARIKVNVGSQVSGIIAKLNVDFNSRVKKGDVLAEIDPRLFLAQLQRYEASVAVAQAEVEKARVTLVDAERTLRRYNQLATEKMAAQADLDNAQVLRDGGIAGVKSAEAGLLQAEADRNQYATNLALTKIRSPIDGVVIDREVDVGQTVAATFQVATLFVIANDMRQMQVLANIDEADIGKVHAGMPASFTVDAFPGETFAGLLRTVRRAPTSSTSTTSSSTTTSTTSSSGSVVTYAAVIDAENPDEKLLQGMTAQVVLVSQEHTNVIRLPNAALRFRPKATPQKAPEKTPDKAQDNAADNDAAAAPDTKERADRANYVTVYVLRDGQAAPVRAHLGIGDGHFVEVKEGLAVGDKVIVGDATQTQGQSRRGPF